MYRIIETSIENPERKAIQYKKLQEMLDFVYTNDCYRKYILAYFGETLDHDCNNCSNCLNEGEKVDKTVDAQKVLSCIYRMKSRFGTGMIVDVLRGSKNKKVLQMNFNELSTYGIMKNYSAEDLKNFINTLVSQGYINISEGTYPVLSLNNYSRKVIVGEEKVMLKVFKAEKRVQEDNTLFEILREIRSQIAKENNVPPYVIFGDVTLKEMSAKYPSNKEEMLNISGVGEVKYKKYGEAFENAIKSFVEENNIVIEGNESINDASNAEVKENEEIAAEKVEHELKMYLTTDQNLYKKLFDWRAELAKKEKNEYPQTIIPKNTLKEISSRYPVNLDQLKDISKVGPKKIEQYGTQIIEIVCDYVEQNNIEIKWEEKKRKKIIIDNEERETDQIAIDMLKENIDIHEVAQELELGISTILGYVTDYIRELGQNDFKIDLKQFYNEEEEKLIYEACEKDGYDKISEIKKSLPPYIRYEAIRAVILEKYFIKTA